MGVHHGISSPIQEAPPLQPRARRAGPGTRSPASVAVFVSHPGPILAAAGLRQVALRAQLAWPHPRPHRRTALRLPHFQVP